MPGYMPVFRLIDVETMAIVERTDVLLKDLNYLTLSYVWGKTPQKEMLFKANRNKLRKENSLKGRLSWTIEDACTFKKDMGTRYIWVDALCIVQDSDADKAAQIGKMSNIYANALLNIIAASGEDSHAGLPGISTDRNRLQKEITIRTSKPEEGICLLSTLSRTSSRFSNFTSDTTWLPGVGHYKNEPSQEGASRFLTSKSPGPVASHTGVRRPTQGHPLLSHGSTCQVPNPISIRRTETGTHLRWMAIRCGTNCIVSRVIIRTESSLGKVMPTMPSQLLFNRHRRCPESNYYGAFRPQDSNSACAGNQTWRG